jgi:hypothetical protein
MVAIVSANLTGDFASAHMRSGSLGNKSSLGSLDRLVGIPFDAQLRSYTLSYLVTQAHDS